MLLLAAGVVVLDDDQGQFPLLEVQLDDLRPVRRRGMVRNRSPRSFLSLSPPFFFGGKRRLEGNLPQEESDLLLALINQNSGRSEAQRVFRLVLALRR